MKKGRKALLITGIVLAALVGLIAGVAFSGMGYVRKMEVNPVDLSAVADGVYPGSFKKGRFSYSVEVRVKDHRIEAVRSAATGKAIDPAVERVFGRILQDQSVKIDTVSGASLTTKAVSKAAENALKGAK
jgi:uncharacterized protein with FMN-binding domain